MKGVLMHTCGENVPLANQKIALIIQGAEVLSTTTNASGYFHIKGDYSEWGDDRSDGKSLVIVNQGPGFGDFDLLLNPPDKFNDTIYKYNSTISVVHIQMDTSIYGSTEDTLIIWNRLPGFGAPTERYEYLGPFMNGQILDTFISRTSPHIGYPIGDLYMEAFRFTFTDTVWLANNDSREIMIYPWVFGQANNACGEYTNVYIKLDY